MWLSLLPHASQALASNRCSSRVGAGLQCASHAGIYLCGATCALPVYRGAPHKTHALVGGALLLHAPLSAGPNGRLSHGTPRVTCTVAECPLCTARIGVCRQSMGSSGWAVQTHEGRGLQRLLAGGATHPQGPKGHCSHRCVGSWCTEVRQKGEREWRRSCMTRVTLQSGSWPSRWSCAHGSALHPHKRWPNRVRLARR